MRLIDSHCHLYLDDFKEDRDAVMGRAADAGVDKFYLPAIDHSHLENMVALEKQYPGKCMAMIGLHPCSVKETFPEELNRVKDELFKRKFAAIGEIGLDFYWDKTFVAQQYEAFQQQIGLAIDNQLPIVIHTRSAMPETIEVVKQYAGKVKGIFHCFGGSIDEARKVTDLGFYLGIGGVVTYKNSGLANIVKEIGLQKLVLETDAPYLTPVPFRGKRNESSYLLYIANKLAEIFDCPVEEVAAITSNNADDVFAL